MKPRLHTVFDLKIIMSKRHQSSLMQFMAKRPTQAQTTTTSSTSTSNCTSITSTSTTSSTNGRSIFSQIIVGIMSILFQSLSHSHFTTLHRTRVKHLYNQLASGFLVVLLVLATEAFRPAGIMSLSGLNTPLHKMLHFASPVVSLV